MKHHWQKLLGQLNHKTGDRILDVGGAYDPVPIADVTVDIVDLGKGGGEYVIRDVTWQPLPFANNEFDICICSQTLEDLTSPTLILYEIQRVAKRGVIEVPHRGPESVKGYYNNEEREAGIFSFGASHHKWLIEDIEGIMTFTPKIYRYLMKYPIDSWSGPPGVCQFWENEIKFAMFYDVVDEMIEGNYRDFRERWLASCE